MENIAKVRVARFHFMPAFAGEQTLLDGRHSKATCISFSKDNLVYLQPDGVFADLTIVGSDSFKRTLLETLKKHKMVVSTDFVRFSYN